MRKSFIFLAVLSLIVFSVGFVNACDCPAGLDFCPEGLTFCPAGLTLVAGIIYENTVENGINNAEVEVICHGEHGDIIRNTTSSKSFILNRTTGKFLISDGVYRVCFSQSNCDLGDGLTVNAEKDGLMGTSTGNVDKQFFWGLLDVGFINVPLVPEFGFFVGMLTILSATVVFFVVRKE